MSALTIPPGFTEQRSDKRTWWVKVGWETALQAVLTQAAEEAAAPIPTKALQSAIRFGLDLPLAMQSAIRGGRGAVQRVSLREGGAAIVRRYHRGGFVRHFVRDLYWDRPPRPLAELICTETARQRRVPVVEVLGAGVEWVGLGLYHGIFVTREAAGCINLWEWLQSKPTDKRRETVVTAVAQAIACMHEARIAHADLNLTNILVQITTNSPAVFLLDFDHARMFPGALPRRWRERNLRRLRRSLNKLDPGGLLSSPTDREIFCRAYRQPPSF